MPMPQALQSGPAFNAVQGDALRKGFEGPPLYNILRASPLTGATVTVTNQNWAMAMITPAGTIAALTVVLPTPFGDGHHLKLVYSAAVTALTYSGGTVAPAQTAATAGQTYALTWDAVAAVWRVTT